ncbi:MAG: hypothetical protein LUE17_17930 [Planctomycetaceae bacterium]|nr:hypothetical protein [Planctomycetaceae bacterium]
MRAAIARMAAFTFDLFHITQGGIFTKTLRPSPNVTPAEKRPLHSEREVVPGQVGVSWTVGKT